MNTLLLLSAVQSALTRNRRDEWVPDCQPNPNGINHVPGDCRAFYLCTAGSPHVIQHCNKGTVFNGQVCVWPHQTNCDAAWRQTTTTTTTPTTTTAGTSSTTQTTTKPTSTSTTAVTTIITTTEATKTTTATSVATTITTKEIPNINDIIEMANHILDGTGAHNFFIADAVDYGCAGRGVFDPFSKTLGKQVDRVDKAFYIWKKCIQCATGKDPGMIQAYVFDGTSCQNSSLTSRSICECDYALISKLYNAEPAHVNYDGDSCVKAIANKQSAQCCNWDTYMHAIYNPMKKCCGSKGPQTAGTC